MTVIPNWTLDNVYKLFGSFYPKLAWRGSGNLSIGDVVAFSLDFGASAFNNPTATAVITAGSSNHVFGNLTTMTTANTPYGFLAVAMQNITAGTGAFGEFCLFDNEVSVGVVQGSAGAGAAGDFLTLQSDVTAAYAITAGQLFSQTIARIRLATLANQGFCYGRTWEATGATKALKKCLFSGFGLFPIGFVG